MNVHVALHQQLVTGPQTLTHCRRLWCVLKSRGDSAELQDVTTSFIFANPATLKPFVSIHYSWDTARKQAGLPEVRMHDLRHSFASF